MVPLGADVELNGHEMTQVCLVETWGHMAGLDYLSKSIGFTGVTMSSMGGIYIFTCNDLSDFLDA